MTSTNRVRFASGAWLTAVIFLQMTWNPSLAQDVSGSYRPVYYPSAQLPGHSESSPQGVSPTPQVGDPSTEAGRQLNRRGSATGSGGLGGNAAAPGEATPLGTNPPPGSNFPGNDAASGLGPAPTPGLGGALSSDDSFFGMIGDQGPFSLRQFASVSASLPPPFPPNTPPKLPDPKSRSLLNPTVRGFKIADNQSPFPQDRVYYSFNYFHNVNQHLNRVFETPYDNLRVYRNVFGVEKTFADGNGSVGFRLPLNTAMARPRAGQLANQGGNSTALGDLTPYLKYVVAYDPIRNNLVSIGLAITPPTGPATFANAPFLKQTPRSFHTTTLQPFMGYYLTFGKFFLHGFEAIDVPQNYNLPTMIYSDFGLGYNLYKDRSPGRWLTAVVPTFEVHVSTPINHRNPYSLFDKGGTPDVVNLTSGVNFEILSNSVLTFGLATPVTGPRPFNVEAIALLNFRFGAKRRIGNAATPFLGG